MQIGFWIRALSIIEQSKRSAINFAGFRIRLLNINREFKKHGCFDNCLIPKRYFKNCRRKDSENSRII